MKSIFSKIAPAALAVLLTLSGASCTNDLDLSIHDPQTNTTFDANALMAKIYGNLVLTGVEGPAGKPDMTQFDEGRSSFFRRIFEANELSTDEVIWTWQSDASIPELTNISWNSSHGFTELMYYRLMFNITLCNSFLDETQGTTDATMHRNRAEVRFMRALHYYYFCDLFGKAPFKTTVNDDLPVEKNRREVFDYVVSELKTILGEEGDGTEVLADAGTAEYGRADKAAAWMLLSRMYLNAEVYTGTAQWQNAIDYSTKVIDSGKFDLNTTALNGYTAYEQLFMGDNGENSNARKEIIFPIRNDGMRTRNYGGTTYLIASTRGNGTPDAGLSAEAWSCNRAREAGVLKFFNAASDVPVSATTTVRDVQTAANDDRALFFSGADAEGNNQRTVSTETKGSFTAGLGIVKWSNLYATGGTPSHQSFADGDIPLFRLAEAYLTRAEARYRLDRNLTEVLSDLNRIRSRAHATNKTMNDMNSEQKALRLLIDEWGREFYFEGRRRSDLVRFGMFTTGAYLWDWKGGSYAGNSVSSIYNIFPIPYGELQSNPNMTQNPGY